MTASRRPSPTSANSFRFLGDTGCYYFLYVVGEKVPGHEQWAESRGVDPGTMRSKPAR
jgi:hypothetical protein